jgi:hypothetical protein
MKMGSNKKKLATNTTTTMATMATTATTTTPTVATTQLPVDFWTWADLRV